MTSPAGVGTSPSLLAQALPSDLSPLDTRSSYSWEEVDDPYDPNDDLLNMFVTNLGPGVGTARRSPAAMNTPPAGAGSPAATSTPRATVAGVGTFTTRNIPGRATTPPGQEYLSVRREANDRWWLTKRPGHVPPRVVNNPDACRVKTHLPPPVIPEVDEGAVPVAVAVDEVAVEVVAEAVVVVAEAVTAAEVAVVEAVVEAVEETTKTTTIPPPRVLQGLPDDVDDGGAPIDC